MLYCCRRRIYYLLYVVDAVLLQKAYLLYIMDAVLLRIVYLLYVLDGVLILKAYLLYILDAILMLKVYNCTLSSGCFVAAQGVSTVCSVYHS